MNSLYIVLFTPSVPDTAVTPSDNFSVFRMDRTAEAGKSKGGGVCFMINKKWCDPRNISSLSCSCSPHLEHLSIICRPFYLPVSSPRSSPLLFISHHRQTPAWPCLSSMMCSAATSTSILMLPLSSRGILTKPTSGRSCQTFTNMYPVQLHLHLHLHLVIWQTLLSKATYNWGIHKAIHLEEAIRQRKCS